MDTLRNFQSLGDDIKDYVVEILVVAMMNWDR